jgi:Protein of unknown function (DUF1572)
MEYYKIIGDKTISQVTDQNLFWKYNEDSNSIATIVKHLSGNMLSRWTDFLTTDGEKEWRNRAEEFENTITTKQELIDKWEKGWSCFFDTFNTLTVGDLNKEVVINKKPLLVVDTINKNLAHYVYHVGQIVFIGKMFSRN